MDADPDTLATAPHVTIDDLPKAAPQLAPWRPPVGIAPKLSDAELVTLAAMQALLGFASEARWLRHADRHLRHLFPDLPGQSGHNQRLRRAAGLIRHATRAIAADTALWTDDGWIVDSPPVACGRSRQTAKRSELAGWAQDRWCASPWRRCWGCGCIWGAPCTACRSCSRWPTARAADRQVLWDLVSVEPGLVAARPGQVLLADQNYCGQGFEHLLAALGVRLLRPARKGEPERLARGCSSRCGS